MVAAGEPIAGPLIGLLGVAVTALVAFVTTWRWPTLRRRVQEHAAVVKDLPEGMGADLRAVLAEELAALAFRERIRFHDPRMLLVAGLLGTTVLPLFFVPLTVALSLAYYGHAGTAVLALRDGYLGWAVWTAGLLLEREMGRRRLRGTGCCRAGRCGAASCVTDATTSAGGWSSGLRGRSLT